MLDLFMFVRPHASSPDAHERLPPSRDTKLRANIWFQILGPQFAADVTIWWRRPARFRKVNTLHAKKARLGAGLNLSTISAVEY
ncbi:MAG: hypothetical protein WA820_18370 [Bradyrhizobium sp.]|jgi:hypothetical protein